MLCSVPVFLWSLSEIVRFWRLDAIGLLALLGIFLSLGPMAIGGSAWFLLLRESLVTGMIGIVFLASLLFPRPLAYYLARSGEAKRSPEDLKVFDAAWHEKHSVRAMYLITYVWGLGLVSEAALRCWLVWSSPVEQFLTIPAFIGYGIYFSLMGWSLWYRSPSQGCCSCIESCIVRLMANRSPHYVFSGTSTGKVFDLPCQIL